MGNLLSIEMGCVMAQFYTGPHFWDRRTYEITVKTGGGIDRKQWVADMTKWAQEHGMQIEWSGESTHDVNGSSWHEAHFFIADERDRVAFALRWA